MYLNGLKRKSGSLVVVLAASVLLLSGALAPALSQTPETPTGDVSPDAFGDIFVHPRDQYYLPGKAPSRATLQDTRQHEDVRGTVNRYEYERNGTVISRETWTDVDGQSRGRFGVGIRF